MGDSVETSLRDFAGGTSVAMLWPLIRHPDYVINRLQESGLFAQFPEAALQLLFAILGDQLSYLSPKLRQRIDAIGHAMSSLRQDHRYMRVDELARGLEG